MVKHQLLGDAAIEIAQSAVLYPGSGCYLMYIFLAGVIAQYLSPDPYGSLFCNFSNPWNLEQANTS
jgi:hypothetical protein